MSDKKEDEKLERETNTFDGKCRVCDYGMPAVNEDLVYCGYITEVLAEHGNDLSLAKLLTSKVDFHGFVYEGYVDLGGDVPELRNLVDEASSCNKFMVKP